MFACAALSVTSQADRSAVSFIGGTWSEGPLLLELHRMEWGGAIYTPPRAVNAYDYGPVYVVVLDALRKVARIHATLRAFRLLTIVLGLLAALPLGYAATTVARRAGSPAHDARRAAAAAGALLGAALLSHNVTFARLHPDNLAYALVATAVALHFGIAARMLDVRYAWGIVAFGLVATFTKQNCGAVAPILLAGLASAGAISLGSLATTVGAYALFVSAAIATMPADMRAWTVLVPLAHRYEFNLAKVSDAFVTVSWSDPYLEMSIALALGMLFTLRAGSGTRTLWVDLAAAAAVASAALSGYFKQLGTLNDLVLLAAATVPYAGAAVGILFASARAGSPLAASVLLFIGTAFVVGLQARSDDPRPTITARDQRNVERAKALATQLCARGRTILVLAPLEEFFSCPLARFALTASLTELQLAYPRYDAGPTALSDVPDTGYVVGPEESTLPDAWLTRYHLVEPRIASRSSDLGTLRIAVYERD
jgi:hypothetical protein